MRRGVVWLVAVSLLVVGSQAAHAVAYRLVYPDAHLRVDVLLATGHSYLRLLPLALGLAAAVTAVSLVLGGVDAARGRRQRPLPAWAFGLLPLLAFAVQEHVERWLASGIVPWHAAAEPTFLPGLALQLPFGLTAYLVARLLLRMAERVGRSLAPAPRRPRLAPIPVAAPAAAPDRPRPALLSCGLAKRGPPLLIGA